MKLPPAAPVMAQLPATEKQPAARLMPFAKDDVAVAPELMAPAPVNVRPFDEERPAVVTPAAKVELAVVPVAFTVPN